MIGLEFKTPQKERQSRIDDDGHWVTKATKESARERVSVSGVPVMWAAGDSVRPFVMLVESSLSLLWPTYRTRM
ncbi:hypothetical protein TNCV_2505101 [Trichonephila clavipes]|uniref:Uncharacterized protein n=1 Tax=Trichonephila clavipes TaxID=2585209 RepID=A0A8X6WFQ7_TRICX|nr:hypothetical protein TNCV_2505101 [Trichonephila clavipes]